MQNNWVFEGTPYLPYSVTVFCLLSSVGAGLWMSVTHYGVLRALESVL